MNKQSKAAFWEGSDQSYEIMLRSHEERGKEIIDLKARITELESFRNNANETLANALSESHEHEEQIALLTEALVVARKAVKNYIGDYETVATRKIDEALEATKEK